MAVLTQTQEEFRSTVKAELDSMYRTAYRMLRDSHEAEDAVQEALDRAWSKLEQRHGDGALKPWLFRILVNVCLDWLRLRRRQNTVPYDLDAIEGQPGLVEDRSPDAVLSNKELGGAIDQAIDDLASEHRVVVQLIIVEGFSYDDAASVLDLPVGTVRSRLSRARGHLRDALDMLLEGSGRSGEGKSGGHLKLVM